MVRTEYPSCAYIVKATRLEPDGQDIGPWIDGIVSGWRSCAAAQIQSSCAGLGQRADDFLSLALLPVNGIGRSGLKYSSSFLIV